MGSESWLGVELRHFLALEAVSREGTFGKAAGALGYTQSAVSQQIAALERIVGQRLVERPGGPKPVSLTEAGDVLLRHSHAIMARLSAAQADIAALADGTFGTLCIGTMQSVGARVLPTLIRRFHHDLPDVRSDDNGTVQGLAAAGHGCALVPRLTIDASDDSIRVIEMAHQLPPRLIGIAWHRDRYRSAAARAFVDLAGELCAEIQQQTA